MFSLYHSSGFYCASVTKVLLGFLVIFGLILNIPLQHYKKWFNITHYSVWEQSNIFQLIGSHLVFTDPKDVMCAAILLYHFRIFERRYGSTKYSGLLFGSYLLSIGLITVTLWLFHTFNIQLDPLPSGPYGPLFSLFIPYYCSIPRVAITQVMGVPFTGKSFNYIIGLQLASGSVESLVLAFIGLIAGILYACNFLGIQQVKIPSAFSYICYKVLGCMIETKVPNNELPLGATLELQRIQKIELLEQNQIQAQVQQSLRNVSQIRNFPSNLMNISDMSPPAENQVQQLVDMGFNRDHVLNALRLSNNDTNIATNFLLSSS